MASFQPTTTQTSSSSSFRLPNTTAYSNTNNNTKNTNTSNTNNTIQLLVCSGNLGNAPPDEASLAAWIPADGRCATVLDATCRDQYPVMTVAEAEAANANAKAANAAKARNHETTHETTQATAAAATATAAAVAQNATAAKTPTATASSSSSSLHAQATHACDQLLEEHPSAQFDLIVIGLQESTFEPAPAPPPPSLSLSTLSTTVKAASAPSLAVQETTKGAATPTTTTTATTPTTATPKNTSNPPPPDKGNPTLDEQKSVGVGVTDPGSLSFLGGGGDESYHSAGSSSAPLQQQQQQPQQQQPQSSDKSSSSSHLRLHIPVVSPLVSKGISSTLAKVTSLTANRDHTLSSPRRMAMANAAAAAAAATASAAHHPETWSGDGGRRLALLLQNRLPSYECLVHFQRGEMRLFCFGLVAPQSQATIQSIQSQSLPSIQSNNHKQPPPPPLSSSSLSCRISGHAGGGVHSDGGSAIDGASRRGPAIPIPPPPPLVATTEAFASASALAEDKLPQKLPPPPAPPPLQMQTTPTITSFSSSSSPWKVEHVAAQNTGRAGLANKGGIVTQISYDPRYSSYSGGGGSTATRSQHHQHQQNQQRRGGRTVFSFVTCHLEAHEGVSKYQTRCSTMADILAGTHAKKSYANNNNSKNNNKKNNSRKKDPASSLDNDDHEEEDNDTNNNTNGDGRFRTTHNHTPSSNSSTTTSLQDVSMTAHYSFVLGDLNFRTDLNQAKRDERHQLQQQQQQLQQQQQSSSMRPGIRGTTTTTTAPQSPSFETNHNTNKDEGSSLSLLSEEDHKATVRAMVAARDWTSLHRADELNRALRRKDCLVGYQTLFCNFPPTFKVERGAPGYTYIDKRRPSYTDRILYKTGVVVRRRRRAASTQYYDDDNDPEKDDPAADSGLSSSLSSPYSILPLVYQPIDNFTSSDHKPVRAAFSVSLNEPYRLRPKMTRTRSRRSVMDMRRRLLLRGGGGNHNHNKEAGIAGTQVAHRERLYLFVSQMQCQLVPPKQVAQYKTTTTTTPTTTPTHGAKNSSNHASSSNSMSDSFHATTLNDSSVSTMASTGGQASTRSNTGAAGAVSSLSLSSSLPNPYICLVSDPPELVQVAPTIKTGFWHKKGGLVKRLSSGTARLTNRVLPQMNKKRTMARQWPTSSIQHATLTPNWCCNGNDDRDSNHQHHHYHCEEIHCEIQTHDAQDGSPVDLTGAVLRLTVMNARVVRPGLSSVASVAALGSPRDDAVLGTVNVDLVGLIQACGNPATSARRVGELWEMQQQQQQQQDDKQEKPSSRKSVAGRLFGGSIDGGDNETNNNNISDMNGSNDDITTDRKNSNDEFLGEPSSRSSIADDFIPALTIDEPILRNGRETGRLQCTLEAWWMNDMTARALTSKPLVAGRGGTYEIGTIGDDFLGASSSAKGAAKFSPRHVDSFAESKRKMNTNNNNGC